MHFFSTFLHYVFPVLCKCNLFSTTSCIFSTMSNIFLTTSNIYTTMSKTDYTCIQPKKDKHANDGSSVQKEEKIKDFTKNGKGGGQVVFHRSFTDIEAHGDFVIGQTFLTAHPVDFASLGRHLIDRTVDDRLQLADEQGFFL